MDPIINTYMVLVSYSIDEHILTNITNITSIFCSYSPNPGYLRVPVVQKRTLGIILPVKRIKQLLYIYNEKNLILSIFLK